MWTFVVFIQTDTGDTWSRPSFIGGAGSVDPKLLRVGQFLVMSGGRNCNNINKTIDGQIRGADLMLWLNADGMASEWVTYSLSYWHNHLGFPGQTNCTEVRPVGLDRILLLSLLRRL